MHDLQDQIQSLFETGLLPVSADDIARRHRPVTAPFPAKARRAVTVRRVTAVGVSLAAAGCTAAIVASQLSGAPARPALVDAAYVRHLAAASRLALARSGQAVITSTMTEDKRWSTSTFRLTFSGANFNDASSYTAGGPGVRPLRLTQIGRVVDGQVYNYDNHAWYHDTGQTAADIHIPDPRPLLAELSPSARFVRVGAAVVDGVPVEHLQATALAALPAISVWPYAAQLRSGQIVSLDIWVDDHSVVRRLAWSVDAPTAFETTGNTVIASGHMEESTVVTFQDIGQPQVINVPPHALPAPGQG